MSQIPPAGPSEPRYVQTPGVLATRLGDEAVLLQPETGRYHTLNATATAVWDALAAPATTAEAAAALAAGFDVDVATARADARRTVASLLAGRLVTEVPDAGR